MIVQAPTEAAKKRLKPPDSTVPRFQDNRNSPLCHPPQRRKPTGHRPIITERPQQTLRAWSCRHRPMIAPPSTLQLDVQATARKLLSLVHQNAFCQHRTTAGVTHRDCSSGVALVEIRPGIRQTVNKKLVVLLLNEQEVFSESGTNIDDV